MDIKDLSRSQLILLALLLSFVTSLATGITTVTLMQQAPQSVTVPINRVVRETVDKIVPQDGKPVVNTVVVKEEDLVVSAVADNKPEMFSISMGTSGADGKIIETRLGDGFAVSDKGIIAANASEVPSDGTYFVENQSGKFTASFIPSGQNKFSLLKIGAPVNGTDKLSFPKMKQADLSSLKAGQKIVLLGDNISSFIYNGSPSLDMGADGFGQAGSFGDSIVLDLNGEVIGFAFPGAGFVPLSAVNSVLNSIQNI